MEEITNTTFTSPKSDSKFYDGPKISDASVDVASAEKTIETIHNFTDSDKLEPKNSTIANEAATINHHQQPIWEASNSTTDLKEEIDYQNEEFYPLEDDSKSTIIEEKKKPKRKIRYNADQIMNEQLLRQYRIRQSELVKKIADLDRCLTAEDPSEVNKQFDKIQAELKMMEPFINSITPTLTKQSKRVTFLSMGAKEKEIYTPERNEKAKKFISEIHQKQEDLKAELLRKQTERNERNQMKLDEMRKDIEKLKEKERNDKLRKFEEMKEELHKREEKRKKNVQEWLEFWPTYKRTKPLYVKKEDEFREVENKIKEDEEKLLKNRLKVLEPLPDNFFREHARKFMQTREMLSKQNTARRLEQSSLSRSLNFYRGRFHDIIREEEQKSIDEVKLQQLHRAESRKKQIDYANKVKNDIKFTTKKWEPYQFYRKLSVTLNASIDAISSSQDLKKGSPTGKPGRFFLSIKKSIVPTVTNQELRQIGNKNLEYVKKLKKKAPNRDYYPDKWQPDETTEFSEKTPKLNSSVNHTNISASMSPAKLPKSKINYLPGVREKYGLRNKRRKSEWEVVLDDDELTDVQKFEKIKINLEKLTEGAKRMEKKIKYVDEGKGRIDEDKNSLDGYYLSSIKAKIALLNSAAGAKGK